MTASGDSSPAASQHSLAQRAEEAAHAAHRHVGDGLGVHLLEDLAILERVARAGRRLRAIRQQPPAAIRRARQIRGVDVQPGAVGGPQAVAGPEVVRMSERQLGGNVAFGQQPLRSVEIGQQRVQQPRALRDARFDGLPLRGRQDERQRIERPGAVGALRIGVDVVGDAVLDDQPARQLERAAHRVGRIVGAQAVDERPPVRAHRALRVGQLVVAVEGPAGSRTARMSFTAHASDFTQIQREREFDVWRFRGGSRLASACDPF